MKKLYVSILCLIFTQILVAQNPQVVNGVATYTADLNIGKKFPVPDSWNKIVIKANVTITGSFYMGDRSKAIEICGEDRKTSVLQGDGSRPTDDGLNGRTYSAIRCDGSPDLYVHDMKITKPMKFHIHGGFGKVIAERCDVIAGTETATTDGIHGGLGQTIVRDCYIDVHDDALYTAECTLVENTTIIHNKNGGPLMTCWGAAIPNKNHTCVIRNVTVIDNYNGTDYNHGIVGWAARKEGGKETLTLKFEGYFKHEVAAGKQASPMYTFGRKTSGISDSHYIIDGICPRQNSVDYRESSNCTIKFLNCEVCNDNVAPSIPQSLVVNSVTHNSVDLSWGASTDNVAVTGYEIYVDDKLKTSASGNVNQVVKDLMCATSQSIKVRAYDACLNYSGFSNVVNITTDVCPPCVYANTGGNGAEAGQTAYGTTPTIPGKFEAEDFDGGGEAVAFHEVDGRATWAHTTYRLGEALDIDELDGTSVASGAAIGGISAGEWAEYTINVPANGTYMLTARYGCNGDKQIYFKIDNQNIGCVETLPSTGKASTYADYNVPKEFVLTAGTHVFSWVSQSSSAFNLDYFEFSGTTNAKINLSETTGLLIYPNPASSTVYVETISENISLYDISGNQVNIPISKLANGYKLDMDKLKAGLYFVKAGNKVGKIIKE